MNRRIRKLLYTCHFPIQVSFIVMIIHSQLITALQTNQSHLEITKAELQGSYLQLFETGGHQINNDPPSPADLPDASHISEACPKSTFFYDRNPRHMQAVQDLQNIIMREQTSIGFIKMSSNFRNLGEIHPKVWLAAVISATENRPDTRHLEKPPLVEVMPDRFVPYAAIEEVKMQAEQRADNRTCIRVDERFARDNGRENTLWYFREDIQVNSYHWYWHQAYPAFSTAPRADRRGELFAYMHHHVLARYDADRISQGFPRVQPLSVQNRTVLPEGYFAHLNDTNSRRPFTDRPPQTTAGDVYLGNSDDPDVINANIITFEKEVRSLRRLEMAIDAGSFNDANGNKVSLQNFNGIDLLTDLTEACLYSRNPSYFGRAGLHNDGHMLISFAADPKPQQAKPTMPPGVMADTSTSMRDIIFYRWHKFLDDLFERHKQTLPPYQPNEGSFPLSFPLRIRSFRVDGLNGRPGFLNTFWSEKVFDLSRGLDLGSLNGTGRGPLNLCVKYLNHEEFRYTFTIEKGNGTRYSDAATVRIFMAPRLDEAGRRFSMDEQRKLFFALDIFTININEIRDNTIVRNSQDSTLTIPISRSYDEIQSGAFRPYCGCGWPHHLLIPKGSEIGEVFDVFAMISDERPNGTITIENATTTTFSNEDKPSSKAGEEDGCRQAPVLCGLYREKYPFRHPMNYPFDRVPYNITVTIRPSMWWWEWRQVQRKVQNLEEYTANIPNMATTQVTIVHMNTTVATNET